MGANQTTTELSVYKPFIAELTDLEKENKNCVFDYRDPKGNKAARSHIYKLRQSKSAVEKVRVEEKQASLEYGRRVDAQAKVIKDKLDAMIEVHAKPIREIEEEEKQRVANIESRIEEMKNLAFGLSNLPSSEIQERLSKLKAVTLDNSFDEFLAEAGSVKDASLTSLEEALQAALKGEAEQAELKRLREEAEERARKDREEQIRAEAEAKAKKEAEEKAAREREEAERKAKAEKEAAEKRELELKLQAEAAERRAAEAAETAKREQEEKLKREREEEERRAADEKHKQAILSSAVSALVNAGVSEESSTLAITLIANGDVPNVSISF